MTTQQIDFSKPINIKAFLFDKFNICGCCEVEPIIGLIKDYLKWLASWDDINDRQKYNKYFDDSKHNIGLFYLISGLFENADLSEHGTACRYPWITPLGKSLHEALNKFSAEEIDMAFGESYSGEYFPEQ